MVKINRLLREDENDIASVRAAQADANRWQTDNGSYSRKMTRKEIKAYRKILSIFESEGRKTYAKLFKLHRFRFFLNTEFIAFMQPYTNMICMNEAVDEKYWSLLVRHELMHEYLDHMKKSSEILAEHLGFDINSMSLEELFNLCGKYVMTLDAYNHTTGEKEKAAYKGKLDNIVGDLHISMHVYTDEDKELIRNFAVGGVYCGGIVYDDINDGEFTSLKDATFEDLFKYCLKKLEDDANTPLEIYGTLKDDGTFIGEDGTEYGL